MKRIIIVALLSINNCQLSTCFAQNLSGRDIIQKVKDRPDGNTRFAELELPLRWSYHQYLALPCLP